MTACGCGSRTGYHTYACPLRFNGMAIQQQLDEDVGGMAALMDMGLRPSLDDVEAACMRLYDTVLDAIGGDPSPARVTKTCEAALEAALHVTEREGAFEASQAILQRLDWFSAFAPR